MSPSRQNPCIVVFRTYLIPNYGDQIIENLWHQILPKNAKMMVTLVGRPFRPDRSICMNFSNFADFFTSKSSTFVKTGGPCPFDKFGWVWIPSRFYVISSEIRNTRRFANCVKIYTRSLGELFNHSQSQIWTIGGEVFWHYFFYGSCSLVLFFRFVIVFCCVSQPEFPETQSKWK